MFYSKQPSEWCAQVHFKNENKINISLQTFALFKPSVEGDKLERKLYFIYCSSQKEIKIENGRKP